MQIIKKYLWVLPALFVAYEFGGKILEVLDDASEFTDIVSVIIPIHSVATFLAYAVGVWDLLIAILLLVIPNLSSTKKYSKYIFLWVIFWPLVPACLRYFGGVAEFEIVEVSEMIGAAIISALLYFKLNK